MIANVAALGVSSPDRLPRQVSKEYVYGVTTLRAVSAAMAPVSSVDQAMAAIRNLAIGLTRLLA